MLGKNLFAGLLIASLSMGQFGCSNSSDSDSKNKPKSGAQSSSDELTRAIQATEGGGSTGSGGGGAGSSGGSTSPAKAASSSSSSSGSMDSSMRSTIWFLGSIGVIAGVVGIAYLATGGDLNGEKAAAAKKQKAEEERLKAQVQPTAPSSAPVDSETTPANSPTESSPSAQPEASSADVSCAPQTQIATDLNQAQALFKHAGQ